MKLFKNIFWMLVVATVAFTACDEEEDLLANREAANDISFPDYPAFSATFTSLDQVVLDVAVEGPATSLSVSGDGQSFGDVNITGGTGTFTSTLANLGLSAGDDIQLTFTDGETRRFFTVSVVNPIAFNYTVGSGSSAVNFTSSTTVNLDSAFNIYFEASTVNGTIDNYQVFTKNGKNADYPTAPDVESSVGGTSIEEEALSLIADDASYDIGDTLYYNLVLNAGSLSASSERTVIVTQVALANSGTVTLLTPDYEISDGVTDSLNNAFNFSALKVIADSVLADNPDSADIRLVVNMGNLSFEAGVGSNTSYVVADEDFSFASATYESVSDAFAAGMSASSVDNLESLYTNAVVLVEIGNIPNPGYPSSDNKKYAAIQIQNIVKTDGGTTSEVTFEYKAPQQAD